MGLKSMLVGKKPRFIGRSAGERRMLTQARGDLAALQNIGAGASAYLDDIADPTAETRRARATGNADVMQATSQEGFDPTQPGRIPRDRAHTRARALARMGWAGADTAQNDSFYQRMNVAQFGRAARRGATNVNSTLSDIAYQNKATQAQLSADRRGIVNSTVGFLAGAGANSIDFTKLFNRRPGIQTGVDYSTQQLDPNQRVV